MTKAAPLSWTCRDGGVLALEQELRLVIGFPSHYYERETDVSIGWSSRVIFGGWPFHDEYERQIQSPLLLGLNFFSGVLLSFAGAKLVSVQSVTTFYTFRREFSRRTASFQIRPI